MANANLIQQQLKNRDSGFSLLAPFYNDEQYFQQDIQHIFLKSWIFVGHPADIPENGDYICLRIGQHSFVLLKTESGEYMAAYNQDEKNNLLFKQYKGRCDELKEAQETLAKQKIHCNEFCGYIFICAAKNPPDFSHFQQTIAPYIQVHQPEKLKIAAQSTIVEKGNWKLVMENNRECYHCRSNHPELILTLSDDPGLTGVNFDQVESDVGKLWTRCEQHNIPAKFYMSEDGTFRICRLPLIGEATSYTLHGGDAVKKRIPGIEHIELGGMVLFHFPNNWNHFLNDHVLSFRVLPLDVQQTMVTTTWLVHPDAELGVDYYLEELQQVWNATNAQDRHLVEQNQAGINSPAYQPGPYSKSQESGVIQFIDWYSQTMQKNTMNTEL